MINQDNNPNALLHKRHGKDKDCKTQLQTIFQYLKVHTATASMISKATGIPQKNITRYKRDLQKLGRLWEIDNKLCKETGFKAWYLTTNPNIVPIDNQLKMF